MRAHRLIFALLACVAPIFASYSYDYPTLLNPYNSFWWAANGTNSISTNFYTSAASQGGALIFNSGTPLPAPSYNYEVKTTLTLAASGGDYVTYIRATSNSMIATSNPGTFYAVEIKNPTFNGSACTATLNLDKQTGVNTFTTLATSTVSCHTGMVVRVVFNQSNGLVVYFDNAFVTSYYDSNSPIGSGQPGVGVIGAPASNGISAIAIGHLDTAPPNAIDSHLVGTAAAPNRIDIQFPEVLDDGPGIGVAYYQFYRGGSWLTFSPTPEMEDRAVTASTTYTYVLQAVDYHSNVSQVTITVTTPPTGAIDPREVGVRPNGSYWGAAGEQIDLRSGNLNFTIPLVKAMSRGGGGVGFNLSYNSQNWRQDPTIGAAKLVALNSLITLDISIEVAGTIASGLIGRPGPDYVGGHFNLYLSTSSLQTALGSDFANFQNLFGGSIDGTRQPAVFGNPAQSNYTLHSKEIDSNTTFQFHFDRYNPFSLNFGLVKHFFAEVLGGHAGTPCLDPAWSATKQ